MAIEDETKNRTTEDSLTEPMQAAEDEEDVLIPGDPDGAKKVLKELLTGILLYGILVQLIPVWFLADKAAYSRALWLGIIMAVLMALHMYRTLERALDNGAGAQKSVVTNSMLRYLAVIVVLVAVQYTGIGSPVVTFIGIMGLKAGAYMQPFVHKAVKFIRNTKQ